MRLAATLKVSNLSTRWRSSSAFCPRIAVECKRNLLTAKCAGVNIGLNREGLVPSPCRISSVRLRAKITRMNPPGTIRIAAVVANGGLLLVQVIRSIVIEEQVRVNQHWGMGFAVSVALVIFLLSELPLITALIALTRARGDRPLREIALVLNGLQAVYALVYSLRDADEIRATWHMVTFWKFAGLGFVFWLHLLAPVLAVVALLSAGRRPASTAQLGAQ